MAGLLKKCTSSGELYTRPLDIEAKLDVASTQEFSELFSRAAVTNRVSPDYLPSECLVNIIRGARCRNDDSVLNAFLPILLTRCMANLSATIFSNEFRDPDYVREEILQRFTELFITDGKGKNPHRLDYFECRFNKAFETFRISIVRGELAHEKRMSPLPEESENPKSKDRDKELARVLELCRTPATQEGTISMNALLDAIEALPPDERDAVVLCHVLGYPQESDDITKESAATRAGVTGRTIRNRLTRAAAKLSRFLEDI